MHTFRLQEKNYFDTSELFPPYNPIYNAPRLEELQHFEISMKATLYKYEDYIIDEREGVKADIKKEKVLFLLKHHHYAFVASDITCLNNNSSTIEVACFIGHEINPREENSIRVKYDKYIKVNFTGTWEQYIKFSHSLYVNSHFLRTQGYDLECFSVHEKITENGIDNVVFDVDTYTNIILK